VREQQDRFLLVPNFACDKGRLIVVDELDFVDTFDVAVIDDDPDAMNAAKSSPVQNTGGRPRRTTARGAGSRST
jgi:hypothetical protein